MAEREEMSFADLWERTRAAGSGANEAAVAAPEPAKTASAAPEPAPKAAAPTVPTARPVPEAPEASASIASQAGDRAEKSSRARTRKRVGVGKRGRSRATARKGSKRIVVICVVILALLAVIPVFANTAVGYVPVLSAAILIGVCALYLAVLKRRITFGDGYVASTCVRGDKSGMALPVRNESFLPAPRIGVEFFLSDIFGDGGRTAIQMLTLPPHSDQVFSPDVRFDHIGVVRVGITAVSIYDPIGLFSSVKEGGRIFEVSVIPRAVELESFQLSDYSLRESSKSIKTFINEGMEYTGVRDYEWGDPMKSIHWKLSSKLEDSYYTRLYETPTAPALAVFVDLEYAGADLGDASGWTHAWVRAAGAAAMEGGMVAPDDRDRIMDVYDTVVESALAVEAYASAVGYDTELLFVGKDGSYERLRGPLAGRHAEVMARMPVMAPGSGRRAIELLLAENASPHCPNNLVVCTGNITTAMIDACITVASPARFPFLFAVDRDRDHHAETRRSLAHLTAQRIPFAIIKTADDLKGGGA